VTEIIHPEAISRRRMLSLLGIAAAVGVGGTMLIPVDAEAQTAGMERRQDRRMHRRVHRTVRRTRRGVRRTMRRM
jgi:hypothetical protein